MPIPGLTTITVTGTYQNMQGTGQNGTITFTPTATVIDASGEIVVPPVPIVVTVSGGTFSVVLPCTNNSGLSPSGWAWQVNVNVPSLVGIQSQFTVLLPSSLGATVDISALTPAAGTFPPGNAITNTANTWTAEQTFSNNPAFKVTSGAEANYVLTSDASGNATWQPTQGGGSVTSVFTRTGAVVANTGDYTVSQVTGAAPLASPALTGSPTAPTQTTGDNSTKIATDAFVTTAVSASLPLTGGTLSGPLVVGGALSTTPVALTDAATIAVNAALSDVFTVTLGGSRTLGTPSNPTSGQSITVEVTQPGSGGPYTLSYSGGYAFTASTPQPSLSTTAGDTDYISFIYNATSSLWICTGYVLTQNGILVSIAQGGTGQVTQQAAINALTGAQSSGTYLRSNGTNASLTTIQAADLPTATTSAQGAVELDGTATDIQQLGVQSAGSIGKAADAGHIHPAIAGFGIFGDGSDSTATLDGTSTPAWTTKTGSTYTQTRDAYLTSLTVNSGVTLVMGGPAPGSANSSTGGYQLYCQGTITNNGLICCNGNVGAGTAAAGATGSSHNAGGRPGGNGGTTAGTAATNFGGWALSITAGSTSTGGAGGTASSNTAGAGAVASASQLTYWYKNPFTPLTGVYAALSGGPTFPCGGGGGGGGAGDGTNRGGGGGSGGGLVIMFAYSVINNGTITANGGNGGTPPTGNCGGGGGGGGGAIVTYTLNAWTPGTTSVAAGTGAAGVGSGTAGANGIAGSVFNVVL
jgi:hypothetical protein